MRIDMRIVDSTCMILSEVDVQVWMRDDSSIFLYILHGIPHHSCMMGDEMIFFVVEYMHELFSTENNGHEYEFIIHIMI